MPAKLTPKDPIQPPKSAVKAFKMAVVEGLRDVEKGKTLRLAEASAKFGLTETLKEARKKFKGNGSNVGTIAKAVKWAREQRGSIRK